MARWLLNSLKHFIFDLVHGDDEGADDDNDNNSDDPPLGMVAGWLGG